MYIRIRFSHERRHIVANVVLTMYKSGKLARSLSVFSRTFKEADTSAAFRLMFRSIIRIVNKN